MPWCCGPRRRRAARWPTDAEHPARALSFAVTPAPDRPGGRPAGRWPPYCWWTACGCYQAGERRARAARKGFRTVWSSVDLRGGQGGSLPAGPPTAMVHVTRPTPRPGHPPVPVAQAWLQGQPAAVRLRDSGPGQGPAAQTAVRHCRAPRPDLPAGGTRHDAVPARGPAFRARPRHSHGLRSDLPASRGRCGAEVLRTDAPPRELRLPEFGRPANFRQSVCSGA